LIGELVGEPLARARRGPWHDRRRPAGCHPSDRPRPGATRRPGQVLAGAGV